MFKRLGWLVFLLKIMIDLNNNNIVYSGLYSVKLNLDILEPQLSLVWEVQKLPLTCMV